MAKDPAFLFYPGDFNTGTQFFSDDQVGKYMRLLMAQHQHGHLTEDQVIFICKSYDNHIMSKLVKDSKGLWYNERLEIEIIKRKNYTESRSKNKEGKTKTKIISKSYDTHMENENRNEYFNIKETENIQISNLEYWGKLIVNGEDQYWEQMKGRKITIDELDNFISVATRCSWEIPDQQSFRVTLKGFKSNDNARQPNKTTSGDAKSFGSVDYKAGLR